ncbi:MAG: hypothetical protein Q4F80_08200, partial [bacterium]|nr:hypothetical protein [bacterium]
DASYSIPSVISNSQQQEFKTGLRKAVSVLNSAITMNMALDGETPYDNANLYGYLMKHMAVMESVYMPKKYLTASSGGKYDSVNYYQYINYAFYTTDGMRFEFPAVAGDKSNLKLYENNSITLCPFTAFEGEYPWQDLEGNPVPSTSCGGCGSLGLNNNTDGTTKPPCLIMADVNGDRKPNPNNVNCKSSSCANENKYKYSDPDGKKLTDLFTIMITDKEAIPYGVAAQRAMYQAQR